MKKLLVIALLVTACSEQDEYPSGTWSFRAESFSGTFTINNDGEGTGMFNVKGVEYTTVNRQIRKGSLIVLSSEDRATVILHNVSHTNGQLTSSHQEFRECCLPTPLANEERNATLVLSSL